MATERGLDKDLVEAAKRLGRHRTKREAVNEALREYVMRRRQRGALDLLRGLEWDAGYDYKAARRRF
jgi:Arc/MetJ family transcription regulator